MRGENTQVLELQHLGDGPSPRAWGKRSRASPGSACWRTIPTCVGKTLYLAVLEHASMDHPHVRGENGHAVLVHHDHGGPSPRAWGKRRHEPALFQPSGTIPTCVGKTSLWSSGPRSNSDHPHVRGENPQNASCWNGVNGPSPRAWGKRCAHDLYHRLRRTIPTCVGKTVGNDHAHLQSRDHPHVRGENDAPMTSTTGSGGPSPRAWGKHR